MEVMVVESPPEFLPHIARSYSVCNRHRSGDSPLVRFQTSCSSSLHRFLVHSVSECSDDVICRLIADLDSPSLESKLLAATELRFLAKHSSKNRIRIARAGAVAPLVALLSHPDPQLQEQGVTAIFNLSLCDENKSAIAGAGAIRHLVFALRFGTPAARENSACALLRLAQRDDLRAAIGRSDAIPALVSLLETGRPRGKKDAATALFAILAAKENRAQAVEAGAVRPLLDMMANPESGMVDKAAYVLHRVLSLQEGCREVVAEGGVPVLVEMVEVGTRRQKAVAMLSLLEICKESAAYRKMVVREGGIPPVVALVQASSEKTKEKAEALIALLRQPTAPLS